MTKARNRPFFHTIFSPMQSDHTPHPAPIRIRDPETRQTATPSHPSELSSPVNPLLSLVSQTRQRLIDNPSFRAPYVKCLLDLRAAKSPIVKRHLCKIRRSDTRPADADVLEFLVDYWPEVLLTKDPDRRPRSVRDVGRVWPRDGAMHVSRGMAAQIVEKVRSSESRLLCNIF